MTQWIGRNYRYLIQLTVTVFSNSYVVGFFTGKIYNGKSKYVCVPGLNCYSCPGALGSCPIGAYQAVVGGRTYDITLYVTGVLVFFGVLFARFVCGFLCPFGFFQDLLYKIPLFRLRTENQKATTIKIPKPIDEVLRYVKYAMLLIPVILLPALAVNQFGIGAPYFCTWICPVGSLQGGIPLVSQNESLQHAIGFLFNWKMTLLGIIILGSVLLYRPFCKYLCPLGAFYALFNGVSFYKMEVDSATCTRCGKCETACHMQVDPIKKIRKADRAAFRKVSCGKMQISSTECIRCGDCKRACPCSSITSGFKL